MKLTNEILKEYKDIEAQMKALESRKKEINEALKERGSFSTGEYVVAVSNRSMRRLAGLDDVAKVVGMDVLEKNDLVKVTEYQTVTVSEKA